MGPEWRRAITGDLKEEYGVCNLHGADQVFADEKPARTEVAAGTDPPNGIRTILVLERYDAWLSGATFPVCFERFPPVGELAKATNIGESNVKLAVVCGREPLDKDPNKQVESWKTKVVEEIMLNTSPAGE